MASVKKGSLFVLEGIDGTGKSTHAKRLSMDYDLVYFREPGSVASAEAIRSVLMSVEMSKDAQALMFIAARTEFVRSLLIPTLESGRSVILDRYYFSTLAYQHGALPWDVFNKLHAWMPKPDKVLLLECDPEVALSRSQEENVMEREGLEFFKDLHIRYRQVVKGHPTTIIDANDTIQGVYSNIIKVLSRENPRIFI